MHHNRISRVIFSYTIGLISAHLAKSCATEFPNVQSIKEIKTCKTTLCCMSNIITIHFLCSQCNLLHKVENEIGAINVVVGGMAFQSYKYSTHCKILFIPNESINTASNLFL
jgi:hypothetical protein